MYRAYESMRSPRSREMTAAEPTIMPTTSNRSVVSRFSASGEPPVVACRLYLEPEGAGESSGGRRR